MYSLRTCNAFKKDLKRCSKRNYNLNLLQEVLDQLIKTGTVPETNKPHPLKGDYQDCMECHTRPDWLLIWIVYDIEQEIELVRTGTHSDLFGW